MVFPGLDFKDFSSLDSKVFPGLDSKDFSGLGSKVFPDFDFKNFLVFCFKVLLSAWEKLDSHGSALQTHSITSKRYLAVSAPTLCYAVVCSFDWDIFSENKIYPCAQRFLAVSLPPTATL